jgi:hypothetical protein
MAAKGSLKYSTPHQGTYRSPTATDHIAKRYISKRPRLK